jgi:uncharacterized protein YkwD
MNTVSRQTFQTLLILTITLFTGIFMPLGVPSRAEANGNSINSIINETGTYACLSPKEAELLRLVNEYRESNGLPPVVNSRSLNKVARIHVLDLYENRPADGKDSLGNECNLHSWSDKGNWTGGCYTHNSDNPRLMWDKAREITDNGYFGEGYENAYWTSAKEATPIKVLEGWKKSPSHNALLLENGVWRGSNLMAIGVGIYKGFAVIWVGELLDRLGPMTACSDAGNS